MTKAQIENKKRFIAVQAEAKKLKAKNPKLTHIMAVKQAWAIMQGKPAAKVGAIKKTEAKKPVVKKAVKRDPIYGRLNLTGKETNLGYVTKKVTTKKPAVKKMPISKHKDTKSHNVNIKVVSGMDDVYKTQSKNKLLYYLSWLNEWLIEYETAYLYFKNFKPKNSLEVKNKKEGLLFNKKMISEFKTHIKELKKHI